jgi:hypothetical protein
LLSGIIEPHRKLANVDQLRLHICALFRPFKNKARGVLALSPLTRCSKNNRNKERAFRLDDISIFSDIDFSLPFRFPQSAIPIIREYVTTIGVGVPMAGLEPARAF